MFACKESKKDCSVTEDMTNDDVDMASCTQYIAIHTIENREIEATDSIK